MIILLTLGCLYLWWLLSRQHRKTRYSKPPAQFYVDEASEVADWSDADYNHCFKWEE